MDTSDQNKIRFTNAVAQSTDYLQPLSIMVDVLNRGGIKISSKEFLSWLFARGYVDESVVPTKRALDDEYIVQAQQDGSFTDSPSLASIEYLFTGKGMYYFFECLYCARVSSNK